MQKIRPFSCWKAAAVAWKAGRFGMILIWGGKAALLVRKTGPVGVENPPL